MDGVLVDVSESYRLAIQETVHFFSDKPALPTEIQALKEQGSYNNDWDLTEAILVNRGKAVPKAEIVSKFQEIYWGTKSRKGVIDNEKWLLPKEQLVKLRKKHCLGIVTGRPREETQYTLRKFGVDGMFDVLVVMEDYPPEKAKPDAYPIKLALEKLDMQEAVYVGDSTDDIKAAKRAGVEAIGCIPRGIPASQLKDLLLRHGAKKVLDNIGDINEALNCVS